MPSHLLRKENKVKVLEYVFDHSRVTRDQLVSKVGVAHSTLSYIVRELAEEGFLIIEEIKTKRGRPYQMLRINPKRFSLIGVKVGREEVRGTLFDASLNPLRKYARRIFSTMRNKDGYTAALKEVVQHLIADDVLGVGVCSSGIVEESEVVVSHLMGVKNWDVREVLKEVNNLILMNDVDVLCYQISQGMNSDFLVVSYGTGIGASFWSNGKVHHVELGHTIVSSEGKCYCGQTGCLEYHSSEYAVLKSYLNTDIDFQDFVENEEEKYRKIIESLRKTAREDFESVKRHYEKAFQSFSIVLGNVLMMLRPAKVFFVGEGLVNEDMVKLLEKYVRKRFISEFIGDVEFTMADLDWMLGAARAVVKHYLFSIVE
ncbi:ROK family transcriptional regulator [Thermotoga sp. KOL6]|uniref:ROK family transcriptional regulator n=1 Tax=Thermotoga sp. KOL6 TaxID=126741 RepID=UPI000C790F08|nr:ROK family transcriptional regulator [Thermotoga sp. KOL6]PLV59125.1 ArsR family transcriptional regulator [Thermotoga sp. KOL6]